MSFWASVVHSKRSWHLIGLITKALLMKHLLVNSRASYKFAGNNNSNNHLYIYNHPYKLLKFIATFLCWWFLTCYAIGLHNIYYVTSF